MFEVRDRKSFYINLCKKIQKTLVFSQFYVEEYKMILIINGVTMTISVDTDFIIFLD